MQNLTELWKGDFGDAYLLRNRPTFQETNKRIPLWVKVFEQIPKPWPKNVLEVGAGGGSNLAAIEAIYKGNTQECALMALEPNAQSRNMIPIVMSAPVQIVDGVAQKIEAAEGVADLAFTCGVLIHIPESDLMASMSEIYRCVKVGGFIVCAEYFSAETRMLPYRDQEDALWTREYGSLWLDNFKVEPMANCFMWKRVTQLDNITWFLFRKTN